MVAANSINESGASGFVNFDGTATFSTSPATQYNVLTGGSTAGTLNNVAPSSSAGIPLVSKGSSSQPIFGTAIVAGGGTGSTSFNLNGAVISASTGTGALTSVTMTNGQVLIGSTGTSPAAATLTAGTGIKIISASNSITIDSTGAGFTWNDITGTSATMAVQNGYLADNASLVTLTLPSTVVQFSVIAIQGYGAGGWIIAQNSSQKIIVGSVSSTIGSGGSVASTNSTDAVELLAVTAGASSIWVARNAVGNLTIT